jgi:hypothetical protein
VIPGREWAGVRADRGRGQGVDESVRKMIPDLLVVTFWLVSTEITGGGLKRSSKVDAPRRDLSRKQDTAPALSAGWGLTPPWLVLSLSGNAGGNINPADPFPL